MEIGFTQPSLHITLDEEANGLPDEITIITHHNSPNRNKWVYKLDHVIENV